MVSSSRQMKLAADGDLDSGLRGHISEWCGLPVATRLSVLGLHVALGDVVFLGRDPANIHHHQEIIHIFGRFFEGGVYHFAAHGSKMIYTTLQRITHKFV